MDIQAALNLLGKEDLVQIASMLLAENVALKSRTEQMESLISLATQAVKQAYDNIKNKEPQQVITKVDDLSLRKLFVRNISFKATDLDLAFAFSKYGLVESSKVLYETDLYGRYVSRGYGFIVFKEKDSADKAIRDKIVWIYDRPAECYLAMNSENRPPNNRSS
jgi:RNA recognition motif-containing protein